MKAIICKEFGPIDDLVYGDVDEPQPGKGEVLVKVKATGVNFPDGLLVQGLYQVKPERPFVPGVEFCGEVEALGEGVKHLKIGQRLICTNRSYGGFAEKAIVNARLVMPVTDDVSDVDAANIMCAHGTAHHALKQRARLKAGETLVVLGAAGGTGIAAVQIGKAMGARVIAVCSSDEKLAMAKQNGADELINYSSTDLKTSIKELTDGKGADVIYDPVGGDAFDQSMRCINWEGRLLVVGFASGRIAELKTNLALLKGCSVMGVFWGEFARRTPEKNRDNFNTMLKMVEKGTLKPHVSTHFPLEEGAAAMKALLSRKTTGKVIITVKD